MSKELNDKLFDTLLEQASSLYINDVAAEEAAPVPEFECDGEDAEQKAAYKNIMKRVGRNEAKPRRTVRRLLLVAAVAAVLTALALNASAVRTFVYKTYVNLGDKTLDVTTESITPEDYSEIVNFENKNDIVILSWLPKGFEVKVVNDSPDLLRLKYYRKDDNIWIKIHEGVLPYDNLSGKLIENNKYNINDKDIMGLSGKVFEVKFENGDSNYYAEWCSDSVAYTIETNCSETMFGAILDNLEYLNN